MAHLFLIAGHGAGDSGAVGYGYTEEERVRALANFIGSFFPGRANKVVGRVHLANVNRAATKVTVIVCWRTDLFQIMKI